MKPAFNVVPGEFEGEAPDVVYLACSGVLHPSESLYHLLMRRSPWEDGHTKYESVPVLERALSPWPAARIVLTSTLPWRHRLQAVLHDLGASLSERVIGYAFEDLTKRARFLLAARDGTTRTRAIAEEDYWRMRKSDIVAAHTQWLHPSRWIAIDEDDTLWPADVRRDRLVLTDGCLGLQEKSAERRLLSVLRSNFGVPNA